MNYTFAAIAPLIGGNPIGASVSFGKDPEYAMSYPGFESNDQHFNNYYQKAYYVLDDQEHELRYVDAVVATCPCAGLSSLSPKSSSDSSKNDYMVQAAKDVLTKIRPAVLWGENAPRLATTMGAPVVAKLREIANENGYTFSLYKTKSILHGLPQVRERSFYFFWKGDKVPVFNYYKEQYQTIEELLSEPLSDKDPMNIVVRKGRPSETPFYRYVLEGIMGGMIHEHFMKEISHSMCVLDYIEEVSDYRKTAEWLAANGYTRESERALRMHQKLSEGGNIMRREVYLPKDKIGAFVGHLPTQMTHPTYDRFLTYRECLRIMKMPEDFILLDKEKNLNHVCQNVPVTTAKHMADEVIRFLNQQSKMIDSKFVIQNNINQKIEYIESNTLDI